MSQTTPLGRKCFVLPSDSGMKCSTDFDESLELLQNIQRMTDVQQLNSSYPHAAELFEFACASIANRKS
jgi:hypothetical protein